MDRRTLSPLPEHAPVLWLPGMMEGACAVIGAAHLRGCSEGLQTRHPVPDRH